jgi:hypothetical protein
MGWEALHFTCKYLNTRLPLKRPCEEMLTLIQARYPQETKRLDASNVVLQHLFSRENETEQQTLTTIYSNLNFASIHEHTETHTGLRSYLGLLLVLYVCFSSIFFVFILPSFQSLFTSMDLQGNALVIYSFPTRWLILTFLILLCIGFMLRFNRLIHNQSFLYVEHEDSTGALDTLILSKKLMNAKTQLLATMFSPLNMKVNRFSDEANLFVRQLAEDELDVASAVQHNYERQSKHYINLVNRRQKLFNIVLGILIVLACYHLLYSIYSPIFAQGEIRL